MRIKRTTGAGVVTHWCERLTINRPLSVHMPLRGLLQQQFGLLCLTDYIGFSFTEFVACLAEESATYELRQIQKSGNTTYSILAFLLRGLKMK